MALIIHFRLNRKDSTKHSREDASRNEYPLQSALGGTANVGSKLLQKMGWQHGQGLGKSNQGRTTIIEVDLILFFL